jgi:hypothetical protein
MIEQIVEAIATPTAYGTLLDDRLAAEAEMRVLHDGTALRGAVNAVLAQLPSGYVTLVGTSPQGIGLAAAAAACRREPTAWQPLDPRLGLQEGSSGHTVIVEPVDPGPGWRSLIKRAIPDATFVFARNTGNLEAA